MAVLSILFLVIAMVFILGIALMIYGMLTAPEGFEDENGFHSAEPGARTSQTPANSGKVCT
jgi:flagellar basal body-associated protein FliL